MADMMKRLNRRRGDRFNVKPYGFCCHRDHDDPEAQYRKSVPAASSFPSIESIHECPALRIREQLILRRKGDRRGADDDWFMPGAGGGDSAAKEEKGGLQLKDATASQISMMVDEYRRKMQEEYEANMDKWALIGEKNAKKKKIEHLNCGRPHWYTEFSADQLKALKLLEDSLFKDKEEKTTVRTLNSLERIGMITNDVTIKPKVIRKNIANNSTDTVQFLNEVYKAISGNYFYDEEPKNYYQATERLVLSGIVFLELPRVIEKLHERLPPVMKFELPKKPTFPKPLYPKKTCAPLLLEMPVSPNWRLYDNQYYEWRKKYLEVPRPFALLPKKTELSEQDNLKKIKAEKVAKAKKEKEEAVRRESEEKERLKAKEEEEKKKEEQKPKERKVVKAEPSQVTIPPDMELFPTKDDWTGGQTKCPLKYRRLLNEKGPLKTDEDFFAELKPCEEKKSFPAGRAHLSMNVQNLILNAEADLYHLTEEADKITEEMGKMAREIFEPEPICDPCCACRQTKKTNLLWHIAKQPYPLIDSVMIDERGNQQIIGTTAMQSPAPSISDASILCFPSREKMAKSAIIGGHSATVDGRPVREVTGVAKYPLHYDEECMDADAEAVVRNVPPCACGCHPNNPEDDDIIRKLQSEKDKNICYAKKFRPNEGCGYTCQEFVKKYGKTFVDDCCACYPSSSLESCGSECEEDFGPFSSETTVEPIVEEKPPTPPVEDTREICKPCGKRMDGPCSFQYPLRTKPKDKDKKKTPPLGRKCTCNSLTEFLQMDLTYMDCFKPQVQFFKRGLVPQPVDTTKPAKARSNMDMDNAAKSLFSKYKKKAVKKEKKVWKKKVSLTDQKEGEEDEAEEEKAQEERSEEEVKEEEEEDEEKKGPFGYRTKSEEALPVRKTITYLTEQHPPDYKPEMIPVRPGGRPCKCRENRNNNKLLMYGIGGLIPQGKQRKPEDAEGEDQGPDRLIESVAWVTPDLSLRGSDEYILEYELHDSRYHKGACPGAPHRPPVKFPRREEDVLAEKEEENRLAKEKEKMRREARRKRRRGEVEEDEEAEEKPPLDRTKDWSAAEKDPYLIELFSRQQQKGPCFTTCSKIVDKEEIPMRPLKPMKPVCECKYERRIVKRKEDREQWLERQKRLKALGKESFLGVSEVRRPVRPDPKMIVCGMREQQDPVRRNFFGPPKQIVGGVVENRMMQSPVTVISAINVGTPCSTPRESLTRMHRKCPPMSTLLPITQECDPTAPNYLLQRLPPVEDSFLNILDTLKSHTVEKKTEAEKRCAEKERKKKRRSKDGPKEDEIPCKSPCRRVSDKRGGCFGKRKSDGKVKRLSKPKRECGGGSKGDISEFSSFLKKKQTEQTVEKRYDYLPKNFNTQVKFFNEVKANLVEKMNAELEDMKGGEFISLSLPDYTLMPQLDYWITYRAFGKNYTDQEKKRLMEISEKIWVNHTKRLVRKDSAESLCGTKKLNFNHALYWKRKIAKLKGKFYKELCEDIVTLGRCMFKTMEFGKFPNVLFKQAYFTYMPPREKDTYILGPHW